MASKPPPLPPFTPSSSASSASFTARAEPVRLRSTVYVNNLDSGIPEDLVIESLNSAGGKVILHKMQGDPGMPTRWAFFEYESEESALSAKQLLNGKMVGRYPINVKSSNITINLSPPLANTATFATNSVDEATARTIWVGNLDPIVSETHLRAYFSERCGAPVTKVSFAGDLANRFAFVEFADRNAAQVGLTLSGSILGANAVKIGPSRGQPGSRPALLATAQGVVPDPGSVTIQAYQSSLREEQQRYLQYLQSRASKKEGGGDSSDITERRRRRRAPSEETQGDKPVNTSSSYLRGRGGGGSRSRSKSSKRKSKSKSKSRSQGRTRTRTHSRSQSRKRDHGSSEGKRRDSSPPKAALSPSKRKRSPSPNSKGQSETRRRSEPDSKYSGSSSTRDKDLSGKDRERSRNKSRNRDGK